MAAKVGDRVRVIDPVGSFGDYDVGDTAVVIEAEADGDVWVKWEARFADENVEANRCAYLYRIEYEVTEAA